MAKATVHAASLPKKFIAAILAASLLAGCAGRAAQPVMARQYGDEQRSCAALKAEMAFIETEIQRLIPESHKTGKNVALGVAGWFLIVPWFFMDLSQAEKEEINAYRQRYNTLTILATEKQCAATTIAKADELEEAEAEAVPAAASQ